MQPSSSSHHVSAHCPLPSNDHGNLYATALHQTIERLIPPDLMQASQHRTSEIRTASRHAFASRRFAGASHNAVAAVGNNVGSVGFMGSAGAVGSAGNGHVDNNNNHHHTATHGSSALRPARRATSPPDDIDFLCAVASRDLINRTVADIRKPDVWNEHLLDVLLALRRQRPELLGAANLRVAASNAISGSSRTRKLSIRSSEVPHPTDMARPAPAATPASLSAHLANLYTGDTSTHVSFVHEGTHYHIVNTKEAFFRAVISVQEKLAPTAVSQQKIDARIKDTADFLEAHWREYYRVVWTRMAKAGTR